MPRCIAYLRISTVEQDTEKNKNEILHLANEKDLGKVEFVEDFVSGRISWKKRKIYQILSDLEKEDAIVVSEFSRLGRSMLECIEVLSFALEKQIQVYAVKGNWELNDSIQSKIMAMVFAMVSEIERDLISKRTKEALAARKAAGIKLGRPVGTGKSKLDKDRAEIEKLLALGASQKFIAKKFDTTPVNLHLWMKKHNLKKMK